MNLRQPTLSNLADYADVIDIDNLVAQQEKSVLPWLLSNGWDYDSAREYAAVIDSDDLTDLNSVRDVLAETFNLDDLTKQEQGTLDALFDKFFL